MAADEEVAAVKPPPWGITLLMFPPPPLASLSAFSSTVSRKDLIDDVKKAMVPVERRLYLVLVAPLEPSVCPDHPSLLPPLLPFNFLLPSLKS